ncbi:hypothetical protein BGZ58_004728 [Dissophora ornata]|nr:hypothetical protein BGZ58_004728 [Dissophora ornata]
MARTYPGSPSVVVATAAATAGGGGRGRGRGARHSSSSTPPPSNALGSGKKLNSVHRTNLQEGGESEGEVDIGDAGGDETRFHDGTGHDDEYDYDEDYEQERYYVEDDYYDYGEDEEPSAYQEEEAVVRELERRAARVESRQKPWFSLPTVFTWTGCSMTAATEPKTNPYTSPPFGIRRNNNDYTRDDYEGIAFAGEELYEPAFHIDSSDSSRRDGQVYERPFEATIYYYLNPFRVLWWILKNLTSSLRSIVVSVFDVSFYVCWSVSMLIFFVARRPWRQRRKIAQTFGSLIISPLPMALVVFVCAFYVLSRQSTSTSQPTGTYEPYQDFEYPRSGYLEDVWELLQPRQRFSQLLKDVRSTVTPAPGTWVPLRKGGGSRHRIQIPEDALHSIKDLESRIEWIQQTLQDLADTEDHRAMQVDNRFYMLDRRVSSAEQRLYEVNDEVESLRQYFIDDEWIEGRVATLVELHQQQQHESKATIADKHALPTDSRSLTNVEHQAIQDLIDEALEKYAADVLAKPDYALHSAGGRIIPQMTFFNFLITEEPTYLGRLLGLVHLMPAQQNIQVENFAVKAIQPDMHMGACWAMNGTQGQIAIRLSRRVVVTEVTVEHVDPRVAFDVRSAPKEMEVWRLAAPLGKEKEGDDGTTGSTSVLGTWWKEGSPVEGATLLTKISYQLPVYDGTRHQQQRERQEKEGEQAGGRRESDGNSARSRSRQPKLVQTFHVPRSKQNVPSYGVVVKVNSNWGHPDFTCLYRVRVHGYEPTQGVS